MAKSVEGVARVFRLLGLSVPDDDRLTRIAEDDRSITDVRNDLLDFGKSQGEDTYRDMVTRLVESRIGDADTAEGQVQGIVDQIVSGEATIDEKYADIDKFILKGSPDGGGGDGGSTDDDPGTLPGVLSGGQTIRVGSGDDARFYQIYQFPPGSGNFVSYQFNDREQLEATFGEDFDINTRSETWFSENVLAEADAEEVIGGEGSFASLSDEIIREAALASGITDPSLVGQMFSDPEMQAVLARAVIGDWDQTRILAEQRKTDFWTETLYPGIGQFYGKTTEPERAWAEYRGTVSQGLKVLGYETGSDGTYKDLIGDMLERGIDAEIFVSQVPTFVRAKENVEFASVLDQWAERELGRNVDFNDWFDLVGGGQGSRGATQPELEAIAEKAQLAYRAQEASADISDQQINRLAGRTDLTDAETQQLFSQYGRSVLALGSRGLERGNLTRDEVLSALAGVEPETGRSIEEVRLQVSKIAQEEGLFDDEKASFFVGFDESGRPRRPGLQALNPEGA